MLKLTKKDMDPKYDERLHHQNRVQCRRLQKKKAEKFTFTWIKVDIACSGCTFTPHFCSLEVSFPPSATADDGAAVTGDEAAGHDSFKKVDEREWKIRPGRLQHPFLSVRHHANRLTCPRERDVTVKTTETATERTNQSPKRMNALRLNWSAIRSSDSSSFYCLQTLVDWLSSARRSLSLAPRTLPPPCRMIHKLNADWLTDMSIKQTKTTPRAWSENSRFERALGERTKRWPRFFHSFAVVREQNMVYFVVVENSGGYFHVLFWPHYTKNNLF